MIASLGQMGQWVFDRFVMASGKAHLFIFTLSAASLTNLILDPIFIFGWFGPVSYTHLDVYKRQVPFGYDWKCL